MYKRNDQLRVRACLVRLVLSSSLPLAHVFLTYSRDGATLCVPNRNSYEKSAFRWLTKVPYVT